MRSRQCIAVNPQPSALLSCSPGGVGAEQGQHLPIPHHQHFQGDDGLQRLPHSC